MAPPIAIIGAGPSGLTLARLLERNSIDYVVYERDESKSSPSQGGSLDLHPGTGQMALKEAGLFDEFQKYARYEATAASVLDKTGKTLLKAGEGRDAPEIDRVQLRSILLDSVPSNKIMWGHGVKSTERSSDGEVIITFHDGTTATGFKLVVGADGGWSKVRHLLTPAWPQYSGKHYLETHVTQANAFHPTLEALVGPGQLMANDAGKNINAQSMSDGSYKVLIGLCVAEDFSRSGAVDLADGDGTRAFLVTHFFSDWAPELQAIIQRSEGVFRAWPLHFLPPAALSWATLPNVTLIGDAAHVTTPFVGEGVNCAMADSLALARAIAQHGLERLGTAVAEYEKDMFPRAIDLITRSTASGDLIFAEDSPRGLVEMISSGVTLLAEPLHPNVNR